MSWTNPKTWVVNELVTAAMLNAHVRDNLLHLFQRPLIQSVQTSGAGYAITSTSYVAVDATNLKLTLTPESGRVMIGLLATLVGSATLYAGLRVSIDNGAQYALWGDSIQALTQVTLSPVVPLVVTGLSAAAHTFELQMKVSGGTITMHRSAAQPLRFFVMEI